MENHTRVPTLGVVGIAALMCTGFALAHIPAEPADPPEMSVPQAAPLVEPEEATCLEPGRATEAELYGGPPATELVPSPAMSLSASPGQCHDNGPFPVCSCGGPVTCLCDLLTGECRWICLCET